MDETYAGQSMDDYDMGIGDDDLTGDYYDDIREDDDYLDTLWEDTHYFDFGE